MNEHVVFEGVEKSYRAERALQGVNLQLGAAPRLRPGAADPR